MGMMSEFKEFAMRGSVVDLAVGVVIGGAFGKIVTSLVDQIIMPPIGVLTGGVDFSSYKWVLIQAAVDGKGEVAIGYGAFINTLIQFLIIAWAIFMVIKAINRMTKKENPAAAEEPTIPPDVTLLTEIRDLLRNRAP